MNRQTRTNNGRIDLFFTRIQCFIPLLHEPRFRLKFQTGQPSNERYTRLAIDESLVLTAMMALSARFSSHEYFGSAAPKTKGKIFLRRATALYEEALHDDKLNICSLTLLQGCILLAFYQQTHRTTTQSWLLIGTCCRVATDIGLNMLDSDMKSDDLSANDEPEEAWTFKEEKRRAWWLVCELDVFASTILRRPHSIDKDQMLVMLPVSDLLWFSDTPGESTFLQTDPLHTWQTLDGCDNQDERAWFLVTSFLMAKAADLALQTKTTLQDILNFEATLNCFALLLPPNFHLNSARHPFNEANFASQNWVICTIFMLHT